MLITRTQGSTLQNVSAKQGHITIAVDSNGNTHYTSDNIPEEAMLNHPSSTEQHQKSSALQGALAGDVAEGPGAEKEEMAPIQAVACEGCVTSSSNRSSDSKPATESLPSSALERQREQPAKAKSFVRRQDGAVHTVLAKAHGDKPEIARQEGAASSESLAQDNDQLDKMYGLEEKAKKPPCVGSIVVTMRSTDQALCVPASGGMVRYFGSVCEDDKIIWTAAEGMDLRPGLTRARCAWSWYGYSEDPYTKKFGGTCGVAPTVSGGSDLPTRCQPMQTTTTSTTTTTTTTFSLKSKAYRSIKIAVTPLLMALVPLVAYLTA